MGQKINPIALRLGGRINWLTLNPNNKAKNSNLHESIFINYLVSGVFKSFNIFVSELVIKKETISSESLPGPVISTGQGLPKDKPGRLVNHNKKSPPPSPAERGSGGVSTKGWDGVLGPIQGQGYLLWNYRRKSFLEINQILKNERFAPHPILSSGQGKGPMGVRENFINRESEIPGAWTNNNNKDIIKISGLIYLGSSPKKLLGQGRTMNQKARPGHGRLRAAHNPVSMSIDSSPYAGDGNSRFNTWACPGVKAIKNKSGKNQSRRTKLLLEEINKLIIKLLKIVLLGGNYKSQTEIILDFEQIRSPLSNSNILSNWIELSLLENSRIMNDRKIFKWLFSDSLGKPRESRFARALPPLRGGSTVRGK